MTLTRLARALPIALAALLLGGGIAHADTYTAQFRGDGSSDFGFALMYARWDAAEKAEADGFTDPDSQCEEIFKFDPGPYSAMVIWECTR
ncbi:hypothetical protein FHS29_007282 [Saccharothrix tamanrassetensis]|uniref:Secreted protein n=1 Tax=Saccharothrix tamanrassetensis TaxID=1051531 RepID=A0A841CWH1_9PSEU|nr:hypothetical protein [Saccharothrix tamanrassetensis]MBB5960654.1 hypothetical protein [Saccharothrix tamanrassetensis]